jgi:hypothetical protein
VVKPLSFTMFFSPEVRSSLEVSLLCSSSGPSIERLGELSGSLVIVYTLYWVETKEAW